MTFEMLVGLQVTDDLNYTQYREAIAPILKKFGGGFRFDFKISEVLKKETENTINRVFTIYFKDQNSKENFFCDSEYKKAKENFFEKSVGSTTLIAEYER